MKNVCMAFVLASLLSGCADTTAPTQNKIVGTWELVYAETIENEVLEIKDLNTTRFIKIINDSHFSFVNQGENSSDEFYGGAGTYTLNGDDYVETLQFTSLEAFRNHKFPFKVEFKGDTLIQTGIEEIKAAGIKRTITEKYIKLD